MKTHFYKPNQTTFEFFQGDFNLILSLTHLQKLEAESIRVFPISNWTELDIWQYIKSEKIPIVPLYFAKKRPVVERDGTLIMVDDDRMKIEEHEKVEERLVRFRTLGCYPLTGAIESSSDNLDDIIKEMLLSNQVKDKDE